ncbi:response regulator transcription factor [Allomesorhizobium camelthorni]|uniref:Cell cycle response regulator CtrA n=1 Tax=Allomesorhizobium camelthorni TaxID=475069 RepID=A0A6G4WLH4_9HYPH|nr:response regulator transcription factor [Mesorhizobium camelthorni]NGO55208.1 response regulator transcription factor [Mesorhizobium camelthorni]
MPRILLVEDDDRIVGFIKRGLEAEGYLVDLANNGEDALAMVRETSYSLIVLDRLLPGIDGLDVCRIMQRERREYLVLMLTAKDSLQDKVEGLKGGADDYLTKPFAFDELIARIEALLRRGPGAISDPVLMVGDLTLDPVAKKVRRGGREISLTAKEFRLLAYLMSHPGAVISRTRLLNNVWDLSFDPETKVVDVYIRYLRRKIDGAEEHPLIKTVRGFGYVISA